MMVEVGFFMLATMETINIVEKAEALAKMVMQSEIGENYFVHLYKLKNDQLHSKR